MVARNSNPVVFGQTNLQQDDKVPPFCCVVLDNNNTEYFRGRMMDMPRDDDFLKPGSTVIVNPSTYSAMHAKRLEKKLVEESEHVEFQRH